MTEDEMAGWHHRHNGHEFGWTPGVGDGQGGLVCCGSCLFSNVPGIKNILNHRLCARVLAEMLVKAVLFPVVKAMVFPVVMHGRESWTIKKAER